MLFPMEEVYENYVAYKLKKHPENTWETSAQDMEKYRLIPHKSLPYDRILSFGKGTKNAA